MNRYEHYQKILEKREAESQLRKLRTIERYSARYAWMNGKKYLNFSSNDYLGLAETSIRSKNIAGAGASALISGHHRIHEELEALLSQWKEQEQSILFPAGYMANVAVVSSLAQKDSVIFYDKLCHASLIDGMLLAGVKFKAFRHLDYVHLNELLEQHQNIESKLILTDSVFSMDGDLADLKQLTQLSQKYQAILIVDEAHGTGVYGATGAGLAQAQGVEPEIDVITSTFSKALGVQGGSVSSKKVLIDYCINQARPYIFSTALAPILCQAVIQNIATIQKNKLQKKLWQNIEYFKKLAQEFGFPILGDGPIQPIIVGSSEKALKVYQQLLDQGIFIPPVRYPAVPQDQARLRLTITAEHQFKDLEKCLETLAKN